MKRSELMKHLLEADRSSVWAFTPASLGALLGKGEPNYLKLMLKRLTDQGVLTRAARGVYVNPLARSLPADVRRGLLRFLRPRQGKYGRFEGKFAEAGAIPEIRSAFALLAAGFP